ncbi:MAG TPA: hypothetical protein VME46_02830 [Acidimicrobiales bacterium]|nr:hypothetical protein [Acidimicrobiales bacterium]
MALKVARLTLNRAAMPQKCNELGIRFERQSVAMIKGNLTEMILLRPATSLLPEGEAVGPEPRFNLVVCGMHLKSGDGTVAQGSGQLVITAQRLLGMINNGTATGSNPLSSSSGSVFCFSIGRDDIYAPDVTKRRFKPSDYGFRAREEQTPSFYLTVFSAMASIANGKTLYWHDKNMDSAMSAEGRQSLLKT